MLAASPTAARYDQPAEEIAIHDYENFGHLHIDEYDSITRVARLAHLIAQHGEPYLA